MTGSPVRELNVIAHTGRIFLGVTNHTKPAAVLLMGKEIIETEENQRLQALLKACQAGDRKSQDKLYRQFYGLAMGICLRYARSRDEAIEIVNDGFYKVLTNLNKYTPGLSFHGWLKTIMVNASIDHYRRNEKHYHQVDISYVKGERMLPDVLDSLGEDVIIQAIQELPPSYRTVFNLYVLEGYKHAEIAQKLNISEGTSKSNLNVARIKLRKVLNLSSDEKSTKNG